jgi:hypothetical protein
MAAMFENATREGPTTPRRTPSAKVRGESLTGRIISEYTVSTPPAQSRTPSVAPSLHSRSSTPWRDSLKPATSAESRRNNRHSLSAEEEEQQHQETYLGLPSELKPSASAESTKMEKVALRPTTKTIRPEPERDTLQLEQDPDRPPNLGKMLPPPEEPPVSQHLNRARPTMNEKARNSSSRPSVSDRLNELQLRAGSPNPRNGNSMLHAQIRHLQKKLARRTEELAQARRQLETRENLDIGVLSERLRAAKRECKMWKERAEAAEKRVAAFDRLTKKIKQIRDTGTGETTDDQGSRTVRDATNRQIEEGDDRSDAGTEPGDAVQDRIRASFKAMMDGAGEDVGSRTVSKMGSESSDGGQTVVRKMSGATAQIWMAAQDLLEPEDVPDENVFD